VVEIDGRRIGDSTAIIAALEDYAPEPSLYPADVEERERALALEDWFDEQLAPELRRFVWHHTLADTDVVVQTLFSRPSPVRERFLRATAPVARFIVRRDYSVTSDSADRGREAVRAAMDRLESELGSSDYLVGSGFTVADLTAASLFTPLLCPAERPYAPTALAPAVQELRDELMARPGGAWVARMYARHRNQHVTEGVDALSH
jgi:glutathione S-transferase